MCSISEVVFIMSILSNSLKALAIILGLILSAGSTLIALDAQNLAKSGVKIVNQNSETLADEVVLTVEIEIDNTGYFFDIYGVNITLLIMDNNDNIYDKDTEVIEQIPVGGSETVTLSLSIPIDVAQEWQNGNIDLFAKLYFIFWFGKYDYRLIKFGIVGVSELRGG